MPRNADHTRGLCHKPDNTEGGIDKPLRCQCCGSEMVAVEPNSMQLRTTGVFYRICPDCPPPQ